MKLRDVYICIDCEEIYDRFRIMAGGLKNVNVCPACTNKSGILLSRWIKTMKAYEKEEACNI